MPILARGRHSVQVFGPGKDPFIRGEAGSFDYFPYNLVITPFFAILVIGGLVVWNLFDRDYSAARNLVLLPSAVAVFWGIMTEPVWGILGAAPLHIIACVFLVWRITKVRHWGAATALAAVGAFVGAGISPLPEIANLGIVAAVGLAIPMAFVGIVLGVPYAVTRAAIRGGASDIRAWVGVPAAIPLGLVTFAIVLLASRSPVNALFAPFALFIGPALLFGALVRWNAWARDVATGAMFERREPHPTESASEPSSRPDEGISPVSPA